MGEVAIFLACVAILATLDQWLERTREGRRQLLARALVRLHYARHSSRYQAHPEGYR
ncbi:MAG TPA: hypothetical protein VFX15_03275 [Actinomycetes bacterium]|nr:hypothetical protein [Actinomycetes bacterium]